MCLVIIQGVFFLNAHTFRGIVIWGKMLLTNERKIKLFNFSVRHNCTSRFVVSFAASHY